MCNLYSMTKNGDAIRRLFEALNSKVGNLPSMPGIYPDYPAPVVRNADGGREITMMRWGMPSSQRAIMDAFFGQVVVGQSLVFIYLKYSPLQEVRTDRLIVGAAYISNVQPPPMWNQDGKPPFDSCMWETIVEHSLRPDMHNGVLLPYQELVELLDQGVDVEGALAWAPEGRNTEFSYVTEHLTDDAALEALASLKRAADGARALGIDVPDTALT